MHDKRRALQESSLYWPLVCEIGWATLLKLFKGKQSKEKNRKYNYTLENAILWEDIS